SSSLTASSSRRSGCTPLSARFQATRFSHVDCSRSMANGSSFIAPGSVTETIRSEHHRGSTTCVILWAPCIPFMAVDLLPEFAPIPSGEFVMGRDDADDDERPAHEVHLDDFLIAVHPVTHAEYRRFVQATGHRSPAIYELPLVVTAGGPGRESAFRAAGQPYVWLDSQPPPDRLDHP